MSNIPYYIPGTLSIHNGSHSQLIVYLSGGRFGMKYGHGKVIDGMIHGMPKAHCFSSWQTACRLAMSSLIHACP